MKYYLLTSENHTLILTKTPHSLEGRVRRRFTINEVIRDTRKLYKKGWNIWECEDDLIEFNTKAEAIGYAALEAL